MSNHATRRNVIAGATADSLLLVAPATNIAVITVDHKRAKLAQPLLLGQCREPIFLLRSSSRPQ